VESKFYQPDERRAEKVRELFARIARRYDLLNDIMSAGLHRRWKRRLVGLAGEPRDVLDLCCGTGDLALEFMKHSPPDLLVGLDFTDEMLQVAASRSRRLHVASCAVAIDDYGKVHSTNTRVGKVSWIRADALRLPFADDSFDVVSVGYGLRNLANAEAGLLEILRVLRPGGKLLSLDFGKPTNGFLRALYFGYLRTVLPLLGRLYCGDPDTHGYILVSLRDYGAQRGTKELMQKCGYRDCGFEEFCGGAMAINFGSKLR